MAETRAITSLTEADYREVEEVVSSKFEALLVAKTQEFGVKMDKKFAVLKEAIRLLFVNGECDVSSTMAKIASNDAISDAKLNRSEVLENEISISLLEPSHMVEELQTVVNEEEVVKAIDASESLVLEKVHEEEFKPEEKEAVGSSTLAMENIISQLQVSNSHWEFSLRSSVEYMDVYDKSEIFYYDDMPSTVVKMQRSQSQFALECDVNNTLQMFDSLQLRTKLLQNFRKKTFSKTWWFKFKGTKFLCSKRLVVYKRGYEYLGDAVLVIVPLGRLKAETIKCSPPLLDWKYSSTKQLGFGVINKIVLEFSYEFWDDSVDYFGTTAEETDQIGECFMFWNVRKIVDALVLIALVVGKVDFDYSIKKKPEHVNHTMMVLRKFFGGDLVPDLVASVVTDRGIDPYSYGAYSYVAIATSSEDYDVLERPVQNCLFCAGEATCKEHSNTVGGAMMTGVQSISCKFEKLTTGHGFIRKETIQVVRYTAVRMIKDRDTHTLLKVDGVLVSGKFKNLFAFQISKLVVKLL